MSSFLKAILILLSDFDKVACIIQALLPEKRNLFYSGLAKAVGSDFLARRISKLRPSMHIFGHTHFGWDATLEGEPEIVPQLCTWLTHISALQNMHMHSCSMGPPAQHLAFTY